MSPQARNTRFIIVAFVSLAIVWLIFYVTSFGRLNVAVADDGKDGMVTMSIEREDGSRHIFNLAPGTHKRLFMKHGAVRVQSQFGKSKSIDVTKIRRLGTSNVTVSFADQLKPVKIASDAKTCPIVAPLAVFSFACRGEGRMYVHGAPDTFIFDTTKPLFNDYVFRYTQAYQNGALGFRAQTFEGQLLELLYIDPAKQTTTPVSIGNQTILELMGRELPQIVTSPDSNQAAFALIFRQANRVFVFKDSVGGTSTEVVLDKRIKLSEATQAVSAQLNDNQLIIYAGYSGDDYEQTDAKLNIKPTPVSRLLAIYDTDGNKRAQYELPPSFNATTVNRLAGDFYLAERAEASDFYRITQSGKIQKVLTVNDVSSPLVLKDKAYLVSDNALYSFDSGDADGFSMRSVFSSPKLRLSELFTGTPGLVLTAFTDRADVAPLDVFTLMADTGGYVLPEDTISYADIQSFVAGYAYDDNRIVFHVRTAGGSTPGVTYSDILSRLKAELNKRHINVGNRTIELGDLN